MREKIAKRLVAAFPPASEINISDNRLVLEKLLAVALMMAKDGKEEKEAAEAFPEALQGIPVNDLKNYGEEQACDRYAPWDDCGNAFEDSLQSAFKGQFTWSRVEVTELVWLLPNEEEFANLNLYADYEDADRFQSEVEKSLTHYEIASGLLDDFDIPVEDMGNFPETTQLLRRKALEDSILEPVIDIYTFCIKSMAIGSYIRKKDTLQITAEEKAEIDGLIEICTSPLTDCFTGEAAVISSGEWCQLTLYGTDAMGTTEVFTTEMDPRFPFAAWLLNDRLARLDKKLHFIDKITDKKPEGGGI